MEALYSLMVRKQAEIIQVQREICLLRDLVRAHEEGQKKAVQAPPRREALPQFLAMLACAALIGASIGLAIVAR